MAIEPALAVSIGGIILGWLLSQLSGAFSSRIQRHRCQRKLLRRLMRIQSQLKTLIRMSAHFEKHSRSLEQFETFRSRVTEAHFLHDSTEIEKTKNAISEYSGYYPFRALRLDWVIQVLEKAKAQTFDASIEQPERYVHLLAAHQVVLEGVALELEKEVSKLAWRCGPGFRLQLWSSNRRERINIKKGRPVADQFTKEVLPAKQENAA